MLRLNFSCSVIFALCLPVIAGCASTVPEPAVAQPPEKELRLNLPEPQVAAADCDCESVAEENDFDHGVRALAARDYDQATAYFGQHRKLGSPEATRESNVGLAFVALLSQKSVVSSDDLVEGVDERAEVMILPW